MRRGETSTEDLAPLMLRLLLSMNAAARAKKLNIRKKPFVTRKSRY